jgi:hypothetical protein
MVKEENRVQAILDQGYGILDHGYGRNPTTNHFQPWLRKKTGYEPFLSMVMAFLTTVMEEIWQVRTIIIEKES